MNMRKRVGNNDDDDDDDDWCHLPSCGGTHWECCSFCPPFLVTYLLSVGLWLCCARSWRHEEQ